MVTVPDRLVSTHPLENEIKVDRATRPFKLEDYMGQSHVRKQMAVFIEAAKTRQVALDHVLIAGPPGLGKTTLANIIAYEMGAQLKTTSGPVLEKAGDLAALLTKLESNDVLFIDEIHRLNPRIEEILYPAMEDYKLDILIGEGPGARSIELSLKPFTLVGATTRSALLTSPLRDRFGITQTLSFYTAQELTQIIKRSAKLLNISIDEKGAFAIAQRSRGTPRVANRWLRRVSDFAMVERKNRIDQATAEAALSFLRIDSQGFDIQDRQLLLTLIDKFDGGPVGLDSLAAAIGESRDTIEEVIEPFLIQQGFIFRTSRGRIASQASYQHFKLLKENLPSMLDGI